jgi:hypothetical protein
MKRLNLLILGSLVLTTLINAEEISEEKKAAIHVLMDITGAREVGDQFSSMFAEQMIQNMKAANPELPESIAELVRQEVALVVNEELARGSLRRRIYPIYARYFTLDEIRGLIAFNNSALGKKANRLMPELMRESSIAAQQWGQSLRDTLVNRVVKKLNSQPRSTGAIQPEGDQSVDEQPGQFDDRPEEQQLPAN